MFEHVKEIWMLIWRAEARAYGPVEIDESEKLAVPASCQPVFPSRNLSVTFEKGTRCRATCIEH